MKKTILHTANFLEFRLSIIVSLQLQDIKPLQT